mmetsp:Transcript_67422/g.209047  ORF Transcript_67422/g.209047 Transcript_67422/m.209047 type:complete len:212 (+) Transcript_67422:33-668(+)
MEGVAWDSHQRASRASRRSDSPLQLGVHEALLAHPHAFGEVRDDPPGQGAPEHDLALQNAIGHGRSLALGKEHEVGGQRLFLDEQRELLNKGAVPPCDVLDDAHGAQLRGPELLANRASEVLGHLLRHPCVETPLHVARAGRLVKLLHHLHLGGKAHLVLPQVGENGVLDYAEPSVLLEQEHCLDNHPDARQHEQRCPLRRNEDAEGPKVG